MNKTFIIFMLIVSSLQVIATDVILDKASVKVDVGNITGLANGEIVDTLNIIQGANTPKKVTLAVSYKKPSSICTQEEDYIVTPDCSEEENFPVTFRNCDQYIATRCTAYELSSDPDDIRTYASHYQFKFKTKKSNSRAFQIILKKEETIKHGSNIFDKPSEEKMSLKSSVLKGDFSKVKVRPVSLLRFHTKVILK